MRQGVVCYFVPVLLKPFEHTGKPPAIDPGHKESCPDPALFQNIEYLRCKWFVWTVIEGQCHNVAAFLSFPEYGSEDRRATLEDTKGKDSFTDHQGQKPDQNDFRWEKRREDGEKGRSHGGRNQGNER